MPTETPNYRLITGVVNDDFVAPEHVNRLADTLDRVVASVLSRLLTAGVYQGWEITTSKQVSSGEGLVSACWCSTSLPQEIAELTNNAVNYVFAEVTDSSAWDGSVRFRAQLGSNGPQGSLLLGTIELDEAGEVVAVDNAAAGVDRQCYALAWRTLSGAGSVAAVPPGEEVSIVVEHAPLRVPGAIRLQVVGEDFTWEIDRAYLADGFRVVAKNTSQAAADFVYSWRRHGIAE